MDVIIGKENVRVFAQIITCLAKIGESVIIDNSRGVVVLQTVNSLFSAYVQYQLYPQFFENFDRRRNLNQKYQLTLKHLLAVFRNITLIEQMRLFVPAPYEDQPSLENVENLFIIEVRNSNNIRKTYRLHFKEEEPLQAKYDVKDYPLTIKYDSQSMNQCLIPFGTSVSEISFTLESRKIPTTNGSAPEVENNLRVKSYLSPNKSDMKNMLITQVAINASQFEIFDDSKLTIPVPDPSQTSSEGSRERSHTPGPTHTAGTAMSSAGKSRQASQNQQPFTPRLEMTFNLKDFKAFLTFCETAQQSLTVHMNTQGSPIVFKSVAEMNNNDIEAVCVLATLTEDQAAQQSSSSSSSSSSAPTNDSSVSSFTPQKRGSRGSRGNSGSRGTPSKSSVRSLTADRASSHPQSSTSSEPHSLGHGDAFFADQLNTSEIANTEGLFKEAPRTSPKRKRQPDDDDDDENEDDDRVNEEEEDSEPEPKRQRFD